MGGIGDIVDAIGSAVSSIISGIKSIISSIVKTISTIVSSIASKIASAISIVALPIRIAVFRVFSALRTVIRVKILSNIAGALRVASSIFTGKLSIATFLHLDIESIFSSVGGFISSWIGSIRNFITAIRHTIESIVKAIKPYIEKVVAKIKAIYEAIKASIVGKILKTISRFIDVIEFIHTVAMIYKYVKEEKFFKAIYYATLNLDRKLAREVQKLIEYVNNQISAVNKSIRETFYSVKDDIAYLIGYSAKLEKVFSDIAEALGVKFIEDIAVGLRQFREEILTYAYSFVDSARKELQSIIYTVANPVYNMLWTMHLTDLEYKRYQVLFSYLMADSIDRNFLGERKQFRIIIPVLVV